MVVDHVLDITTPVCRFFDQYRASYSGSITQFALYVLAAAAFGKRISWKNDGHAAGHAMSFKVSALACASMPRVKSNSDMTGIFGGGFGGYSC